MSTNIEPLRSGDPKGVGRYRFLGRLGAGGMGLVCLGRGPDDRLVAVKLIHEDIAADPDYRRRFAREVRAAATVQARFTAAVVDADPEAQQPWYATEYIDGPTLGQVVRRTGPLTERALRALAAGLAEAVAAFEAAGLVHRDLKPDNILLAADGPKVIDFGIARGENDSLLTRAGSVLGSPGYMSPEQIAGQRAKTASDVFSLGAVLAFAGQAAGPFGDGPAESRMYMTKFGDPDVSGMPTAMRDPVLRCLAKEPRDRPKPSELVSWWSVRADELGTLIEVGRGPGAVSGESARPTGDRMYGASSPQNDEVAAPPPPVKIDGARLYGEAPPPPVAPPESTRAASANDLDLAANASAEPWQPQTPWLPGSDDLSLALPANPLADGRLDSRLATIVGAAGPARVPGPGPARLGSPFEAREWTPAPQPPPQKGPRPWWHQLVGVDRLPGGVFRDLVAGLAAAALLAGFSLPKPNTATGVAFAAVAMALGFVLGVRRSVVALAAYAGAALGGVKILPGKIAASAHDPSLAILLELGVLLLFAGGIARVGGVTRRPALAFAVAFAGYVAGQAAAVAWLADQAGAGFLDTWRADTNGLLIYRDAGIAAVCAAAVGFLALIGSSQAAVGVDGSYRATGVQDDWRQSHPR